MRQDDERRIERLLLNTNYRKIFSELKINYNDNSDELWFNCIYPKHGESKPSSKITVDRYSEYCGIFHCFGCKQSGTIIDIVREFFHNEFWDAVLWLEARINYDDSTYVFYKESYFKKYRKITLPEEFQSPSSFENWIPKYRNYVEKRNINHFNVLKYNIGYCDSGKYRNMIIVPITIGNRLVTWVGRHIRRKVVTGPKNGGQGLFGSNYLIQPTKYPAILVEGWIDKLQLENFEYDNVMSIQTNKLAESQINYILNRNFPFIIVIPDNDSGGDVLIDSLGKYLEYIPIMVGRLTESNDPGESSEEEIDFVMKNLREWEPTSEDKELDVDY